MMTTTTLDVLRNHRRADDLAHAAADFLLGYIHEVAGDEPIEVQQQAIYMAGRMLAPSSRGSCFRLPPLDEV
ncbi:MAG: hypothetical protein IJZ91_00735 [Oscillospiraceae bacterium]|nr:hypothetical protein [Oscillospiraceae bacterium]